jgi:hypothetical protein
MKRFNVTSTSLAGARTASSSSSDDTLNGNPSAIHTVVLWIRRFSFKSYDGQKPTVATTFAETLPATPVLKHPNTRHRAAQVAVAPGCQI